MRNRTATMLVSPIERLAYLHTVPLFSRLDPRELLALAEQCFETTTARGRVLIAGDRPPENIHIIVSGRVAVRQRGVQIRDLIERDSLGVLAGLARQTEPPTSVALTRVRTLALPMRALEDLIEARFSIYHSLLRGLCRLMRDEGGELPPVAPLSTASGGAPDVDSVVDRINLMRAALPFARDFPVALSHLADRVEPVELESGATLWEAGAAAAGVYILARGRLLRSSGDRTRHTRAPNSCGLIDALAEQPRSHAATANGETTALRVGREALLDVFEDHIELARRCLAAIAAALLDVLERRALGSDSVPTGLLQHTTGTVPASLGDTLTDLERP